MCIRDRSKAAWATERYASLDLAEFLLFDAALSDAQIEDVERYLDQKFALGRWGDECGCAGGTCADDPDLATGECTPSFAPTTTASPTPDHALGLEHSAHPRQNAAVPALGVDGHHVGVCDACGPEEIVPCGLSLIHI